MTTELMPALEPRKRTREISDPSVEEIIASARSAPASSRGPWFLAGITSVLMWASFTPLDWSPLGWIALVPLILLIRAPRRTRWMYTAIYVGAVVYYIATLQWMRLGDATMYKAWIALSFYISIYFPLFVATSRVAVHRLKVPLIAAVPITWVGFEFIRAHLLTGFSWYYLGHTQYRWNEIIQVSDITGAYGVSFLLAMTAACITGLLPASVFAKFKLLPADKDQTAADAQLPKTSRTAQIASVGVCLTVFIAMLAYGYVRRGQAEFRDGPRVALIQGNFTSAVKHSQASAREVFETHKDLTAQAVKHQPDVIVWPETMYRQWLLISSPDFSDDDLMQVAPAIPVEAWRLSNTNEMLTELSLQAGTPLIIGLDTAVADESGFRHYNSAAFVRPDLGINGRYDKMHRIMFGEFIPLREMFPWLLRFTPYSSGFGIDAGQQPAVFECKQWRLAPIICFEDTVPHLVRNVLKTAETSGGTDCLVNLTNDGWFHGSSELDQHLITASFRCVETRTPMVRAVNTGISAVIDGDGMIVEPDVFIDGDDEGRTSTRDPQTGHWHKQLNAALIDTVPLDDRRSLYVAYGDWFAGLCCFVTIFLLCAGPLLRKKPATAAG